MPAISSEFKQAIKLLTEKEKEKLLIRVVKRDAELYAILAFEILQIPVEEIQEEVSSKIHDLIYGVSGKGLAKIRNVTKAIRASLKEIARFKRITKNAKAEVDLHMYLLGLIYQNYSGNFNSSYKSFLSTTAKLVFKTMVVIKKNLDEDYFVEYEDDINKYLEQIHRQHQEFSFYLPKNFDIVRS